MGDGRQTSMAGKLERRKDMMKMKWGGGVAISATSPQKERRELSRVGSSLREKRCKR